MGVGDVIEAVEVTGGERCHASSDILLPPLSPRFNSDAEDD